MRGGFEWRLRVGRVARAAGWPGAGPAGVARRWRVSLDGLIRRHTYSCVADWVAPAGGPGRAGGRLAWGWPGQRCPASASVAGQPHTSSYVFMRGGSAVAGWRSWAGWGRGLRPWSGPRTGPGGAMWPAAVVRAAGGRRRWGWPARPVP